MRKIGYIALSFYLLLVGLSALIAQFIVPNTLMAALVLTASLGIFLDICIPLKKSDPRPAFSLPPRNQEDSSF